MFPCIHFPVWPYPPKIMNFCFIIIIIIIIIDSFYILYW